jgi:dCMP deaminase
MCIRRPSWDEYFMNIAGVVKTRGNCLRRQVAAVIVKEHRIISTGYNGTPSGVRNCFEGGCPRCASKVGSGKNLGECICSPPITASSSRTRFCIPPKVPACFAQK